MFKKIIILARTIACLVCQVLLIRFKGHSGIISMVQLRRDVFYVFVCSYTPKYVHIGHRFKNTGSFGIHKHKHTLACSAHFLQSHLFIASLPETHCLFKCSAYFSWLITHHLPFYVGKKRLLVLQIWILTCQIQTPHLKSIIKQIIFPFFPFLF